MSAVNFKKTGNGPNILFLHGWGQNKDTWGPIIDLLSKDFTCWLVDLPGFGKNSDNIKDKSPLGYSEWVNKFLVENNLKAVCLLGHSFGGRIAVICAGTNKSVKKLILYATPAYGTNKKAFFPNLARVVRFRNVPLISNFLRSRDYKAASVEMRGVMSKALNFDLLPYLRKINIPTLILWGEKDEEVTAITANRLQADIKNSVLYIIPNGSHFVHLEKPLLFAARIKIFLKDE